MSDIEGLSRDALKARLVAAERQIANLRTGYGELLEEREIKNSQLAALRAAQEWQDISTAPRDEAVLGMNEHGDIGHTHWFEPDEGHPACWWNAQIDDEWHPLWWMPALPPMPTTLIADHRTK